MVGGASACSQGRVSAGISTNSAAMMIAAMIRCSRASGPGRIRNQNTSAHSGATYRQYTQPSVTRSALCCSTMSRISGVSAYAVTSSRGHCRMAGSRSQAPIGTRMRSAPTSCPPSGSPALRGAACPPGPACPDGRRARAAGRPGRLGAAARLGGASAAAGASSAAGAGSKRTAGPSGTASRASTGWPRWNCATGWPDTNVPLRPTFSSTQPCLPQLSRTCSRDTRGSVTTTTLSSRRPT